MNLTTRIKDLMNALSAGIPEREFCIELAFLTTIVREPFYLYGRSGSGKAIVIDRLVAAFKNAKVLRIGRRIQEIPSKLSDYNLIVFQSYDVTNERQKESVQIALQDRAGTPVIISGDLRPEVALTRGEIVDKIALTVALPDSISASALCQLLTTPRDVTLTDIPAELTITPEESAEWKEKINKIAFSADALDMIGKLAELCDSNNIYVSIKKWMVLSNIAKAAAFFNGRTEASLMDTFFLGTNIWGRTISNKIIVEGYKKIALEILLKNIPEIHEKRYDADDLLARIDRLLNSSNNKYDTREFNNEACVMYKVTIAGESTPLYVPLRYIETDGDFNPYNELRQVEKRVRCNYHGTSNCSIAIDSAVKGIGLRTNVVRSSNSTLKTGKFEDYATLPTYILSENDPDIIAQKKIQREEIRKEVNASMERESKTLLSLRDTYRSLKQNRNELFCNQQLFDEILGQIKEEFDATSVLISKIKEAHAKLDGKAS